MSPEETELLKRVVALSEENNNILRSMQRSIRLGRLITFAYWLFIIGSAVGAYYFVQPYLNQILSVYGGAKSGLDSFSGILDTVKQYSQ